ncbi:MAG: pyrimidine 5'-nucleotidase, partial [Pseudomonadota bacterium]
DRQNWPNHIRSWIFDLDNTLYHARYDLFEQVSKRITEFVAKTLELDDQQARSVQRDYFQRYGTTLRGMMTHHGTNPEFFMDYVHDIDYSALPYDASLASNLARLPGKRYIFTNGSCEHAQAVIRQMRLDGLFDAIFDIRIANFIPKPNHAPYQALLEATGIDAREAFMAEDIADNLRVPNALGMKTLWVEDKKQSQPGKACSEYIDYRCTSLSSWLAAYLES